MQHDLRTVAGLMNYLTEAVTNNLIIAPAEWIGVSLRLEVLAGEIDDAIALLEGVMMDEEVRLVETGVTSSKARVLKTKAIDYKDYLQKKALRIRIQEIVMLAKKRAGINDRMA